MSASLCQCVCMPVCLPACLSVCLPACLSVCLPACLSVCLPACLSACLPACLSVCVSACLPICLPVCHCVCLPVCLSASLSVCVCVCLPACLSACLPAYLSVSSCLPACLSACLSVCLPACQPVYLSPCPLPDRSSHTLPLPLLLPLLLGPGFVLQTPGCRCYPLPAFSLMELVLIRDFIRQVNMQNQAHVPSCRLQSLAHTPSTAFRHLPPNSARFSYATEGALFMSAQLSTDAVSALRNVRVLIKLQALVYDIFPLTTAVFSYAIGSRKL